MGRTSRLRFWSKSPNLPEVRPSSRATDQERDLSNDPFNVTAAVGEQGSSPPIAQAVAPSLWKKAYAQLDEDLVARFKELLHRETPGTVASEDGPTLSDVDRICHDGRRRMEEAEMTFRFNNKEHKVHDVFVKGLAVINWAQGLVSAALEKASSPEASIAWAATVLVLPLFDNLDTVREANKTGFIYITSSMKFYIALEAKFQECVSPESFDTTESAIVDLYQSILIFQLQSAIRFNRNKFKTKFRDMVDYDGWKTLLQNVKNAENLVNQRLESLQRTVGSGHLRDLKEEATKTFQVLQTQLEELSNISNNTDEMVEMMKRAEKMALSNEEQGHLQSLRNIDTTQEGYYELAKDRTEKRVDGTCQWLLADERYQGWLKRDCGLLVISADPGCGKSVLSRYLIEEGLPRDDSTICYFFFKDDVQDRVHLALCALLHQLMDSKPFLIAKYLAPEGRRNGESLKTNISVLWDIFENALRDTRTGKVFIVVDGLDECEPLQMYEFCRRLNALCSDESEDLKTRFIVTTRPYPEITSRINAPHIRVAGELESETIREEVKLVIQHRVEGLKSMQDIIPAALIPQLEKKLLEVEHPTYLWVSLTFRFIETGKFKKTNRGLNEAIDRLPRTIHEAYEKILHKTDPEDKEMIRRALTIVLGAKRPMSVAELNVAFNLTPDLSRFDDLDLENHEIFAASLRRWTGLLIAIYNNEVYFLHQTVREFLLGGTSGAVYGSEQPEKWLGTFSALDANSLLGSICLRYFQIYNTTINDDPLTRIDIMRHMLTREPTGNRRPTRNRRPTGDQRPKVDQQPTFMAFNSYAFENIRRHLVDDMRDDVLDLAIAVLARCTGRYFPIRQTGLPERFSDQEVSLLVAASHGLTPLVRRLIAIPGIDIEFRDGKGRSLLVLAIGVSEVLEMTSPDTALALLEAGADPNPELPKGTHPPLVRATLIKELPLVQALIERGARVDNESIHLDGRDLRGRYLSDGPSGPGDAYTLLHYVAKGNLHEIGGLLIQRGADVNARGGLTGTTPLHFAARRNSLLVADLLVCHGADIDARTDIGGWTPLHEAARWNAPEVANLLVSRGANVNALNDMGKTPLMLAEEHPGSLGVRDYLLELSSE